MRSSRTSSRSVAAGSLTRRTVPDGASAIGNGELRDAVDRLADDDLPRRAVGRSAVDQVGRVAPEVEDGAHGLAADRIGLADLGLAVLSVAPGPELPDSLVLRLLPGLGLRRPLDPGVDLFLGFVLSELRDEEGG